MHVRCTKNLRYSTENFTFFSFAFVMISFSNKPLTNHSFYGVDTKQAEYRQSENHKISFTASSKYLQRLFRSSLQGLLYYLRSSTGISQSTTSFSWKRYFEQETRWGRTIWTPEGSRNLSRKCGFAVACAVAGNLVKNHFLVQRA